MIDSMVVVLATVLIFTPCFATLYKSTGCRRALWRAGYPHWVVCCDRLFGDDLHDRLERGTHHIPHQFVACYGPMRSPRTREAPKNGLRLAAWRESVLHHSSLAVPISTQLEHIQIQSESIERDPERQAQPDINTSRERDRHSDPPRRAVISIVVLPTRLDGASMSAHASSRPHSSSTEDHPPIAR